MLSEQKIEQILSRQAGLEKKMSANPDPDAYVALSKEFAELQPVVVAVRKLQDARAELADLTQMLADKDIDADMREMAQEEKAALEERMPDIDHEISVLLLPKDIADERDAILEVRAGTGGDEAALFAGSLFRMYQRYAELRGWKMEIISVSEGDVGGYKEIIASVKGQGVFARMKYESGVHRVQRVPETEGSGRIHTSAATVAVLPEAEEVDVHIEEKDLRVDVFRASGPGGQSVNTTDSAVRITHIPTGIVVSQQDEKSQHKNRAKGMKILRARIFDAERAKVDAERAQARKGQVGTGDRSERIRTYNFPQGRVTDHRINLTLYKLDQVIAGDALDEVVDALISEDQAAQLAALNDSADD